MADSSKSSSNNPPSRIFLRSTFGMLVDTHGPGRRTNVSKDSLKRPNSNFKASSRTLTTKPPRGIENSAEMNLTSCNWIRNHQKSSYLRPQGSAKPSSPVPSLKASGMGFEPLSTDASVFYLTRSALARADGTYGNLIRNSLKPICSSR